VAQKSAFNFLSLLSTSSPRRIAVVNPNGACTGSRAARCRRRDHADVVSGHTNAATIMSGERGADLVRETLRLAAGLVRRERCAQRLHAIVSQ